MTNNLKALLALKRVQSTIITDYQKRVEVLKTALQVTEKEIWQHYTFPSVEAAKAVLSADHEAKAHEDYKTAKLPYCYESEFVVTGNDKLECVVTYPTECMYTRLALNEHKINFEHNLVDSVDDF